MSEPQRMRVLLVDERADRLARITSAVEQLGHEAAVRGGDLDLVGELTRRDEVDVALVGLGLDSSQALDTIGKLVHEAACPVIAVLDARDPTYVTEAAKRGVFAYVVMSSDPFDLQSALDITLLRFAEFRNLQGAFGRRAIIEQAKGILMARNAVDADEAFVLLRSHSQQTGQKLIEVAEAITRTHRLLPPTPEATASRPTPDNSETRLESTTTGSSTPGTAGSAQAFDM